MAMMQIWCMRMIVRRLSMAMGMGMFSIHQWVLIQRMFVDMMFIGMAVGMGVFQSFVYMEVLVVFGQHQPGTQQHHR